MTERASSTPEDGSRPRRCASTASPRRSTPTAHSVTLDAQACRTAARCDDGGHKDHKVLWHSGRGHRVPRGARWVAGGCRACERLRRDPVALCRTIIRLKDADAWDDHVIDIMKRSNVEPATSGQKRDLDMPTPKSLSKQIKAGANRLGDGRPYCSKGNTWGEYREGLKIGSAAVAAAGGSVANAVAASERLAEAGVHIGKSTLHAAAKKAPRASRRSRWAIKI